MTSHPNVTFPLQSDNLGVLQLSEIGSVSVPLGAHFKVTLKDCPLSDYDVERMSKVPYANYVVYEMTKHINVRYHFIREIVESKEIEVAKIGTKDNVADAFTKVVPGPKFMYCMEILSVGAN
ncbi:hypothetical protein Tco_0993958 [Tanacetum coccineum]